jgi:hypothetical protein
METEGPEEPKVRLTVMVLGSDMENLSEIARITGSTQTDALRYTLSLGRKLLEEHEKESDILIKKKGSNRFEKLVFDFNHLAMQMRNVVLFRRKK